MSGAVSATVIGSAIVGSAVIGAGVSIYEGQQQKKAAQEQQDRLQAAQAQRDAEAARISRETRPTGQTVGDAVKFGTMNDIPNSVNDFLVPTSTNKKTTSGLGVAGSGNSGLGFVL